MKSDFFVILIGAFVVLSTTGCSHWSPNSTLATSDTPKQMLARQILVTLPDKLKPEWAAIKLELAKQSALTETGEFPLSSINVDCLVYKVPEQQAIDKLLGKLKADSRIVLAQENQVFEGVQSGESDTFATLSYAPKLIHADSAHRITTGKDVNIAVIDTGAEKDHPDLKGRFQHTANFVEGGDRSFNQDKHGTAVAGVIAARSDDGIGIYGIAPEANISVYKACWYPDSENAKAKCSSWTLAKALDAAINNGAKIINLSLAGPIDELMTKLLEKAHQQGITIVAAGMQDQQEPGFPANLAFTIPVISSGTDSTVPKVTWLPQFPNTVVAPGIDILTTVPKEGYDFISGSSLATAHVSGMVALLLQLKPELTPKQVLTLLTQNNQNDENHVPSMLDVCAIIKHMHKEVGC